MGKSNTGEFAIPQDDLTPVGKPSAASPTFSAAKDALKDPNATRVAGVDFSTLVDDADADDPLVQIDKKADDLARSMDSTRFVLVKFVNAPEYPRVHFVLWKNGSKIVFPRGRWCFARFCDVATARTQGTLDYVQDADEGATNMKAMANHPIFVVQELPPEIKTYEDLMAFKAKADKARGKEIPLASMQL